MGRPLDDLPLSPRDPSCSTRRVRNWTYQSFPTSFSPRLPPTCGPAVEAGSAPVPRNARISCCHVCFLAHFSGVPMFRSPGERERTCRFLFRRTMEEQLVDSGMLRRPEEFRAPMVLAAPFRLAPPGERCPDISTSSTVRSSPTARVKASLNEVAHRNGTPQVSGTQSQGLRERRTPGCRNEPPEGFWSRPEPVRKEVCHAGSIRA